MDYSGMTLGPLIQTAAYLLLILGARTEAVAARQRAAAAAAI